MQRFLKWNNLRTSLTHLCLNRLASLEVDPGPEVISAVELTKLPVAPVLVSLAPMVAVPVPVAPAVVVVSALVPKQV